MCIPDRRDGMVRLAALALALAVMALIAGPARADELTDQAKRDVTAGLAAQKAGQYDEAIALYKKAFDEVPHPEILFDLGQAYRLKGEPEIALGYYRRYLAVEPGGRAARDARHWVTELRKQLAGHDGHAAGASPPPAATSTSSAPGSAPAGAGVAAAKPGASPPTGSTSPVGPAAGSGSPVSSPTGSAPAISTGPAADHGSPAPSAAPSAATLMAPAPRVTAPAPAASSDRHMTYTWIAAGAGGASMVGGLVFGGLARSKRNEAIKLCGTDHQCDSAGDLKRANDLLAQSRTRGTVATVLVIAGASGLVISGALWLTGRRYEAPRTAVAPVVSRDAVGLAFGTVF